MEMMAYDDEGGTGVKALDEMAPLKKGSAQCLCVN